MTLRRIAVLDGLLAAVSTALLWWGHRNYRGGTR